MYSHGRTDIIETHLKGAISEASQETMATLENQQSEMEHHVARLAIVREEKERRRQALWGRGNSLCCCLNTHTMSSCLQEHSHHVLLSAYLCGNGLFVMQKNGQRSHCQWAVAVASTTNIRDDCLANSTFIAASFPWCINPDFVIGNSQSEQCSVERCFVYQSK